MVRGLSTALACILIALAGCASAPADDGGGDPDAMDGEMDKGDSMSGGDPVTHMIDIQNFRFGAGDITIAVGDTIIWTNQDSAPHTVDSTDGGPLDSGNMAQGDTYGFKFAEAGTFAYRCDIHTNMLGSVTVA